MKITFLGAAKTVTGSNYLIEGAGKKFLVDCGLYQGKAVDELQNEEPFDFNISEIDFVLLTHAHIDHTGRIPKLYKEGYRKPVYAHKATCDLCAIMLTDSGHIQETETEYQNKKRKRQGLPPKEPIYTAEDGAKCLEIFKPLKYDEILEIDENIHVRLNDAGHMLGSSIIEVWIKENGKEEKLVFSGDLGNNDIPLLNEPTMIEDADYLILESTYGSRLHMKNMDKAEEFLDIVSETIENGGTVVIPSFAVGRAQEILYEINKLKDEKQDEAFKKKYRELMNIPVYVDSPLAISATEVFEDNMDLFDEETKKYIANGDNPLDFPGLRFTCSVEDSKALNESSEPCIIISASGMCDVGRIKHHLKHNIWNPKSTILFVGYQAPGTLGYSIVHGAEKVKIFGEEFAVKARIEYLEGYSGHADQEGLLHFISSFEKKPKNIFLIHGEPESQEVLKNKIMEEEKIQVIIPSKREIYTLSENNARLTGKITLTQAERSKYNKTAIIERLSNLKEKLDNLQDVVRTETPENNQKLLDSSNLDNINIKVKDLQKEINKLLNK